MDSFSPSSKKPRTQRSPPSPGSPVFAPGLSTVPKKPRSHSTRSTHSTRVAPPPGFPVFPPAVANQNAPADVAPPPDFHFLPRLSTAIHQSAPADVAPPSAYSFFPPRQNAPATAINHTAPNSAPATAVPAGTRSNFSFVFPPPVPPTGNAANQNAPPSLSDDEIELAYLDPEAQHLLLAAFGLRPPAADPDSNGTRRVPKERQMFETLKWYHTIILEFLEYCEQYEIEPLAYKYVCSDFMNHVFFHNLHSLSYATFKKIQSGLTYLRSKQGFKELPRSHPNRACFVFACLPRRSLHSTPFCLFAFCRLGTTTKHNCVAYCSNSYCIYKTKSNNKSKTRSSHSMPTQPHNHMQPQQFNISHCSFPPLAHLSNPSQYHAELSTESLMSDELRMMLHMQAAPAEHKVWGSSLTHNDIVSQFLKTLEKCEKLPNSSAVRDALVAAFVVRCEAQTGLRAMSLVRLRMMDIFTLDPLSNHGPVALRIVNLAQHLIKRHSTTKQGKPLYAGFTQSHDPLACPLFSLASLISYDTYHTCLWDPLADIAGFAITQDAVFKKQLSLDSTWLLHRCITNAAANSSDRSESAKLVALLRKHTSSSYTCHDYRRSAGSEGLILGVPATTVGQAMGYAESNLRVLVETYAGCNPQVCAPFCSALAGFPDKSHHYLLRSLVIIPPKWLEFIFPGLAKAQHTLSLFNDDELFKAHVAGNDVLITQLELEQRFINLLTLLGNSFFQALPFVLDKQPKFVFASHLSNLLSLSQWESTANDLRTMQAIADEIMKRGSSHQMYPQLAHLKFKQDGELPGWEGPDPYNETILLLQKYPGMLPSIFPLVHNNPAFLPVLSQLGQLPPQMPLSPLAQALPPMQLHQLPLPPKSELPYLKEVQSKFKLYGNFQQGLAFFKEQFADKYENAADAPGRIDKNWVEYFSKHKVTREYIHAVLTRDTGLPIGRVFALLNNFQKEHKLTNAGMLNSIPKLKSYRANPTKPFNLLSNTIKTRKGEETINVKHLANHLGL